MNENDDTVSQMKKEIAEAIKTSMDVFLGEEVERTKESISIPVGREKGQIIRSKPGENPRKEEGDLYASVKKEVVEEGEIGIIVGTMFSDDPKSAWLNDGTSDGRIAPRPFWDRAWERIKNNGEKLENSIAESISGSNTPAYSA